MEATNSLSSEFIIGSGGSGTIYRAELYTGETVAVKKMPWKEDLLSNKSFVTEVKILGRIRHRHLVKLIGNCSNRRMALNLLIYEYMGNGSVWDWLHDRSRNDKKKKSIDWDTRSRIVIGLSQGVEYIHHDCVPKIIHRDIKSSNILLDSQMDAHLGDFGIAKLIIEDYDSKTESNVHGFAGSYSYTAPEFAYSFKVTVNSDLYSMGIVMMELVSGKMPTDPAFGVDMDMVRWVEKHLEMEGLGREEQIDRSLLPLLPPQEAAAFQVLEIAVQCTKTIPQERLSPRQVSDQLLHVFNNRMVDCGKTILERNAK